MDPNMSEEEHRYWERRCEDMQEGIERFMKKLKAIKKYDIGCDVGVFARVDGLRWDDIEKAYQEVSPMPKSLDDEK